MECLFRAYALHRAPTPYPARFTIWRAPAHILTLIGGCFLLGGCRSGTKLIFKPASFNDSNELEVTDRARNNFLPEPDVAHLHMTQIHICLSILTVSTQ